jgi:tetratricopeptide (TPR) repeat protein
MSNSKSLSRCGRQIYWLKRLKIFALILFSIAAVTGSVFIVSRLKNGTGSERKELLRVWNSGDYEQAYKLSKNELFQRPVDYFLLTINGFSAYQLGISQINSQDMLILINECIFSLRKALLQKESSNDGRVSYVLGKAYGYKGSEYSDLAIKFLVMADNMSYQAEDIPEYLGLAYAACGDYRNSVAAFSKAFIPGKPVSDTLLLSIARSYIEMEEYSMAAGYLNRCVEISPDSKSVIIARLLLAETYKLTGDYQTAEEQYLSILNNFGENAEAHFQLGELYSLKGDTTKARAEWRLARDMDPTHKKARERLSEWLYI